MPNTSPRRCASLPLLALLLSTLALPLRADSPDIKAAKFASGTGNLVFLAAGVGLPLLADGHARDAHALRAADAVLTSVALSEALKGLTHEERPDGSGHDSFPSGHATAAFAVATVEGSLHPREAGLWYLGAAVIAWSRVRLRRHSAADVVAGAALGAGTARVELSQPRGLLIAPFVGRHTLGLQMTRGL